MSRFLGRASSGVQKSPAITDTWQCNCTLKHLAFPLQWQFRALVADFAAKVVGVSDGDTMTVLTADSRRVKVRLHGIDAP
jgi:endonuclease YncB( thermonuclease family)